MNVPMCFVAIAEIEIDIANGILQLILVVDRLLVVWMVLGRRGGTCEPARGP